MNVELVLTNHISKLRTLDRRVGDAERAQGEIMAELGKLSKRLSRMQVILGAVVAVTQIAVELAKPLLFHLGQ